MIAGLSRQFGALLLAAALLLRVAIPAGWMPVAGPDGLVLTICSGTSPMTLPAAAMDHAMVGMGPAMAGMDHGGRHGAADAPAVPAHEQPCPFTALVLAAPPAGPAVLPLPGVAYLAPAEARRAAFLRAGIGAPPRPATGPPLLA